MATLSSSALPMLLALGACAGSASPTAMRTLSSLSSDPQERNDELASSEARPGPERRPKSKKEQRAETIAATAAAVIGSWFSKSSTVLLGVGSPIDENQLVGGSATDAATSERRSEDEAGDEVPAAPADAGALVPWVRLSPARSEGATPAPDDAP